MSLEIAEPSQKNKMAYARDYIVKSSEQYFTKVGLNISDVAEEAITDFIFSAHVLLLQGFLKNENVLHFHTKVQHSKTASIIFYKSSAEELTGENALKFINIVTISNNAAESLYQVVRQVYSPLLSEGDDLNSCKLQKNLSELESVLRIITHEKGTDNLNVILTIEDELNFWKAIEQKKESSKKEREAASNYCELFEDISEEIRSMQSSSMLEIREAAENIGGLLDDVWRSTVAPYSQERMIHVLDIVGHVICATIQKELSSMDLDLWKVHGGAKDNDILNILSESVKVVQTWTSACNTLTETYWPNYALHAWEQNPYIPPFCLNFEKRLKEIYNIRSTHDQLSKLLSNSEKAELKTDQLFQPFRNINVWIYNGHNYAWEVAVSRFASNLRPAEAKIAEKLKPRLHSSSTKQMLYEFMRYRTLIERPLVKQALSNELNVFVSSLASLLRSIQSQLEADEVDVKMYQPSEMSTLVHQIQWAKQMEAKVNEILLCAENYLKEFEGSADLVKLAMQLLIELKTLYTQLHDEWSRDLQVQVKNGSLQLQLDKPVVEFSPSTRLMVVNFSPRVVWAEQEARALSALGLSTPPAAQAIDTLAASLKHARALQQVASFHNTLGERMIPSTRPLMLDAALELSSLVQDQRAVYWNDHTTLSAYTEKLKSAVLKLESQNTYLTSQHLAIRNIVEKLMDTELLAKQSEWKARVKEIREIIEKVEGNGYKNTDLWRTHWDWQLYKALECQYVQTLMSLHKHFPTVRVDMVLRGSAVRVHPPLEEVRAAHYNQLRRLLALPATFVGVQQYYAENTPNIFADIVDKHSWLGNNAVQKLEEALCGVERACVSWTRRAALACVPDLDALCKENLKEPHDWEINFKACKAYGQAVAKMSFEDEKIDWIIVGTVTLRREFEAQARNLWACLISSLQANCRAEASELDAFVANATLMVEEKALPKNAKELADLSAKQQTLQSKMPEVEKMVEALKRKGQMLRMWGGDTSVDSAIKEWQRVRELILSHQQMFQHQAEIVKTSLSGEWENLNTTVEGWFSRFSQTRSRIAETRGVSYADMMDRCLSVMDAQQQWNKFVAERDELIAECQKFNMELKLSETWKDAEKSINESVNLWSVLKDFNEGYESIAHQEWIVFQKKLHLLDDFICEWEDKLEPFTNITLFIQQELQKYHDLSTSLKYLRGSDFTEHHWREIFSLIGMEYKKPDTLIVKDLFLCAENIKKQIRALQKICTSASNEAAIRSALNELEVWFAGARLTIVHYKDKARRPVPIVKDFKDVIAKVEEQQWVVSSVCGGGGGEGWEARLRAARAALRAAYHAQRRWLYLEPILSNDDGQLGTKFRKVDLGFRQVARMIEGDPRLSALVQSSRLQPMLDSISEQLLACQSALNEYIDEKRSVFPRFYFLSDDDLLELLGQARAGAEGREVVMQTHLKKVFPGTTGVKLGPGGLSITALCSHHNETLHLDHPIDIDCPVEIWLKSLETEMRSTLKNLTLKCVESTSIPEQDPFSLPTQILCLTQNIRFTEQAEKAIISKELHKLKANIENENIHYASAETEDESERIKRQALILQCTHYLSVIQTLIDNNVVSTKDWLWEKQLRFYMLSSKEVVARMGLAQISYSYEYLGANTGQFVRTELADECFLIMTQAVHLGFVSNPFGPAGTGKTETVKALGGLVGRLVLVFNCDEAMDAESMGRLLSGVAVSGAWGCFDEFNRLSAATLAAVSHQLSSLLDAMRQRKQASYALLNGKQVCVSEWCGVAATMNPVGRGYGGRRALPAALERLLRPIAMTEPRGDHLAKHLFTARCMPDPAALSQDLYSVFTIANILLSGQKHYDWGLRALKATVGSCGGALAGRGAGGARNALRTAIRLNTISKLTTYDSYRFENILSMVFANVPEEKTSADLLVPILESSVASLGLIHNKLQVQKCVEVYEQLQQRMGVVIVGPPGSGKTTIRHLLKTALTMQGKPIVEYTICPKAMSRSWLLGHIDHDTRQWTDGAISTAALEIVNQPTDVWSWIVCDGDIDPEWIEALNSVLDDNRLLTLPSGWRIQFGSNINFIFETHSLEHASPATVSRMGIILLSEEVTCAEEVLENWMQKAEFEHDVVKMAVPLLHKTIKMWLDWVSSRRSDFKFKLSAVSAVKQVLNQFEYVTQNMGASVVFTSPEELVYLSVQRSVLGFVKENSIHTFHEELSPVLGPAPSLAPSAGEWVTDCLYMSPRLAAAEPAIRAVFAANDAHLLIAGPDACAKSLVAEYILKDSNSTVIIIDCTPILEPADIIVELKKNNVVRSGGRSSRSSSDSRLTMLVRSLHRARVDPWGSSPVQAFLQQIIQEQGIWMRGGEEEGGMQWCGVGVGRIVATAPTPALLTPRLAAALHVVSLSEADDDELLELAKYYLTQNVGRNISENEISDLSRKMLVLYKEVTETFSIHSHYKWNASHLRRCCENIKWYSPTSVRELTMALGAEANMMFRDRLVTEEDKTQYMAILRDNLKMSDNDYKYFVTKLRSDGVYLEAIEHRDWYQITQKLINQSLTEHEYKVFGDTGVEVCSELAILCPAIARACNGGVCACVSGAGGGAVVAARLVCTALPAALYCANTPQQFHVLFKNALGTASESTRTLIVARETAATDAILALIEAHCLQQNENQNQQAVQNIKQNLGIVIDLDKDQKDLSELIDKYPLLYNEAHLVWLERWSSETLRQMPQLVIQRLIKENLSDDNAEQHETIPVEGFVSIYNSLDAEWMKAPCRYINFIKSYYHIMSRKKSALVQRQTMLSSGVAALRRARNEVATLQAEAAKQEAALSDKQAKANQALDQIGATVRATTDKKEEMYALKKSIEIENQKLQIRKKEIEEELASVEPVIAAARAAVGDIRPEALSEVRSLRAPPDVVRDILEGVLRLMGIADTSWHSMKNFLSKRGVKEDIRCMDASQITREAMESVERLLEKRGSSFEEAVAKRASAACAPLAAWVRANLAYAGALARVQPLQQQQRTLHKNLKDAEAQLEALSSGLETVDSRVSALKQQLGEHTRDAAAIELSLATATTTIDTASALLRQLAHEYDAWEKDLENISKEILELNIRSLLAAAFIVYLPDVTEPQAREYVKKWASLIGFKDPTFCVINFLSTTEKQLKWEADGLSLDKSALKNAVFIDQILEGQKCGFTPLIIDPDGDAVSWLKKTLAGLQCDFVTQQSDKLHTAVQYAVRLGRILVITEVDGIHDLWASLLSGMPPSTASSTYMPATRLLLYTRDATLPSRIPSYFIARLSLLHFTARLDGLTDQLVHYALQQQNPEVNEKSKEIKLKKATLQKQQHELQENLLRDLSSNGDILHDANLLASLKKTRATSSVISESLEAARAVEAEARQACAQYSESALRAAVLTLAVKALSYQRPLVALPTDTVLEMFVDALRKVPDKKQENSKEVVKYLTRRVIERVLLGLHKKDKYIVILHLLKQVYDNIMPETLWQLFLGTFDHIEAQGNVKDIKDEFSWIPDQSVKKLLKLKAVNEDLFVRLSLSNEEIWKQFLDTGELNCLNKLSLSPFEVAVAVAVFRPESLYRAIVAFVDHILGSGSMSGGDALGGGARAAGGGARRPVLLLSAHAADVLAAYAHAHAVTLTQVGIEEGFVAWEVGVEARRGGGWLAIIVGASPFTQDLQSFIATFSQRSADDFNDDFRLWIVTEDRDIPPLISNACVNVILESPEGVKHNVMSTLSSWGNYEADAKLVRLHACLAFFHAIVQERRAYIPQGWSRWYSWEWGEVWCSAMAVRGGGGAAGAALVTALYSARISAAPDRRLLAALSHHTLAPHTQAHNYRLPHTELQLPFTNRLQSYITAFDSLPEMDSPQLLGLPTNCRIAWEKNATTDIIAQLKKLDDIAVIRKSDEKTPLKNILSLWKKLMSGNPLFKPDYDPEKVVREKNGGGGWWGVVSGAEGAGAGRAARALHAALSALARKPHALLVVPDEWQVLWAGPDAPDLYIKEFCHRATAAVTRIERGFPNQDFIPTEVDLRDLLVAERVVWALRMRTAARRNLPPASLQIHALWDQNKNAEDGVVLVGVCVSGAVWSGGGLAPAPPRAPPHSSAPQLLITLRPQNMDSSGDSDKTLEVPLYSSESRERVVMTLRAPLARHYDPHTAQLNATALFVAPLQ